MFQFLREKKVKAAVQTLLPGLTDNVQILSMEERCATYAIAHGLLKVAEARWGRDAIAKPSALSREAVCACVGFLSESHSKIADRMEEMQDRGMADASYAQGMRQLRATEVVIALVGQRYADPKDSRRITEAWKILWNARTMADQAADLLLRYRKFAKAEAVPTLPDREGPVTRAEILALATTLVPVFRKPAAPGRSARAANAAPKANGPANSLAKKTAQSPSRKAAAAAPAKPKPSAPTKAATSGSAPRNPLGRPKPEGRGRAAT